LKNPVYDATVYIAGGQLPMLPPGLPATCNCGALYPSSFGAVTTTGPDGKFTLTNAPSGNQQLVVQLGKWRHSIPINVTACESNPQPDKSVFLPGSVAAGSTDNVPDIAISTGGGDTLECVFKRMGFVDAEYVAGGATTGHLHLFAGGQPDGGVGIGIPESSPMPGTPPSDVSLWGGFTSLAQFDLTLLSCESGETYHANPQNLEEYLNAGGRVLASHYHYAWFGGPLASGQSYQAPADWGTNLASWTPGGMSAGPNAVPGVVVQTLNGTTGPFPKGVAFSTWLGYVGALGQSGVPAMDLSIYGPRINATIGPTNVPSQPWITSPTQSTSYAFSFDTPVNAPPPADGGPRSYCGRAFFTEWHVSGDPTNSDNTTIPPPQGCAAGDLSPQEKALEFMIFDLLSCVLPDSEAPPSN
jgi:hypothetical protein